jgi:hypothetical protein
LDLLRVGSERRGGYRKRKSAEPPRQVTNNVTSCVVDELDTVASAANPRLLTATQIRWSVGVVLSVGLPLLVVRVVGDSWGSAVRAGVVGLLVLGVTSAITFVRDAIDEARYYRQRDRDDT